MLLRSKTWIAFPHQRCDSVTTGHHDAACVEWTIFLSCSLDLPGSRSAARSIPSASLCGSGPLHTISPDFFADSKAVALVNGCAIADCRIDAVCRSCRLYCAALEILVKFLPPWSSACRICPGASPSQCLRPRATSSPLIKLCVSQDSFS